MTFSKNLKYLVNIKCLVTIYCILILVKTGKFQFFNFLSNNSMTSSEIVDRIKIIFFFIKINNNFVEMLYFFSDSKLKAYENNLIIIIQIKCL